MKHVLLAIFLVATTQICATDTHAADYYSFEKSYKFNKFWMPNKYQYNKYLEGDRKNNKKNQEIRDNNIKIYTSNLEHNLNLLIPKWLEIIKKAIAGDQAAQRTLALFFAHKNAEQKTPSWPSQFSGPDDHPVMDNEMLKEYLADISDF